MPRFVPLLDGTRVPNVSLHDPGSVVLIRNQPVDDAPFGFAVPLSCAVLLVIADAAVVVIVGLLRVVNCRTVPNDVPSELDATIR